MQVPAVSGSSLKTVPYGSLNAILPLLEYLESEGFDLSAVLDRAGVPRSALEDVRIRLPQAKFELLWQAAIEASGDPALALRVSTLVKPSTLGVIGYLAAASESGRNAVELVKGLIPLFLEDFECELECSSEVAFLRLRAGGETPASRFMTEYVIGLAITMSRALGATRSDPLEVRFSHAPPVYADEYQRILRLPVRFEAGEDGVLFPIAMLDTSNPSADAPLRQLLERHAADQLARIMSSAPLPERLRAAILSMLPLGNLTAESAAAHFGMSSRTLRRRLREAGTSYQELLDDVRAELARRYLARERRGIDEVAHLLGFSEPSAFTKAFRRWTGQTPADFVRAGSE
ncbi:MAG: AraC family transcriptional regulator [Myxococcota bacterium]|nr:AraC family transcriptional regulator [Myxococcota bacterium]